MQVQRAYHEASDLSSHRGDFFVNPHIKSLRDLRVSFVFISTRFSTRFSCLIRVDTTRFSCYNVSKKLNQILVRDFCSRSSYIIHISTRFTFEIHLSYTANQMHIYMHQIRTQMHGYTQIRTHIITHVHIIRNPFMCRYVNWHSKRLCATL